MNTIVYVGRLQASAKHCIAITLLFFLVASELAAQGGGINPADVVVLPLGGTPKTMFQSFNNADLTNGVSKLLDVIGNPADAYCAQPRTIQHAQVDLRLKMGPTSYEFGRQPYSASVQLFVSEYDAANSLIVPTRTITLSIGFSPGNPNTPEQLYSFDITGEYPNLDHIAVSAAYLATSGNPSFPAPATADLQNNIRLEASYSEVFAVPPFRPSGTSTDPIVDLVSLADNVTQNPVTFQWSVGASGEGCSDDFPNYQFQLLRLYNRDVSKTSDETDIVDTVHWDRAMTIETGSSATQLKLTIPEGTGYYVWRVRPIGNEYPGGIADDRNWGVWSAAPAEGEILALTNVDRRDISDAAEKKSVFFYQEFDDGLNWIYSRTFTEGSEGTRIGEKISYANGLANVKQTQTHLQTDGRFLIGQTVYDYVGRPSLKSLEAPVTSSSGGFGYYNGFLKHKTGGSSSELYTAKNFDAGTGTGTFQNPDPVDAGPLDTYYSDADADLQIPNAGGYAFTRALYSQDGTSRIKEQSGIGATLRVQKASGVTDRTTKTLYSGVSDFELIGMFGDEAPDAASVHKVITIDPNKVTSVQYVSKEGLTIATCLAKDMNDLLADLDMEHELGGTVEQTIKGDPTMGAHDKSTRLATTKPTDVTLSYHITPDVIQSACGSYCSTCDYKVIFSAYNVEDPTDFRKDSIFLPAAACGPLTPKDTSILWHLDGPATYVIERRVLADNTAPESVTPDNPDGKPFLEIHRNAIYQIARDQIAAELDSVYKLIDSTSLDRLYAYLDTAKGGIYRTSDTGYTIRTSCCTIGIPKEQCQEITCSSPLPSFEQMLYERWGPNGSKWPNGHGYPKDATTNIDFGSNLDQYFFTQGATPIYPHSGSFSGGTGAFDAMIQHMVDDGYDCGKLMTAWTAIVESFGVIATRKGDGNPEDVNGDFNLLSLFLRTVGTKYVGTSDCPYGDCGAGHGLGYLEYAYKYFRYDASNYSADCETQCGYSGHAGWGQDTLDAYYPEKQNWRVFYECVNGYHHTLESLGSSAGNFPGACNPADTNCLKALAASVEDTCRSACQAKFWGFVASIEDAYRHVGKVVEGDKYKVDTRVEGRDPSGYVLAGGVYDISLRQIYCEAQALVNHCSDSCSLTIFRSGSGSSRKIDSIGLPAERSRILRALTYSYRIGLYNSTSGTCEDTTGHQDTSLVHISGTTSGSALAKVVVDYLNYRLAEMIRAGDFDTYGYSLCASLRRIFQEFFGSLGCSWNSCGETGTKKSGDGLQSAKQNGSTLLTSPCPSAYIPQIFLPGPDTSGAFFLDDSCNLKFRRICTASGSPDTAIVTLCSHLCDDSCTTDICFKWVEPTIPDTTWEFRQIPCEQEIRSRLRNLISQQAERCVDSQVVYIAQQYTQHCADPKHVSDVFTISYSLAYYHFTLFYFNRAGKLIRTVPPNGVDLSKRDRMSHPDHTYVTLYDYDSYGEVIQQSSPDGGMTQFFYDDRGQLRFSQNSEQMNPLPLLPRFSYTKYDALGRTIETGEGYRPMAVALAAKVNDQNFPAFGQHNRVMTSYSVTPYIGYLGDLDRLPRFTQNRIASTMTDDGVATYYSYDPHGNVEWLIQQIPGLGNNYIRYEYDLISNNLLKIFYNEGKADQFYHRYSYDPDNRMSMVETSRDGKIWDRDAQYTYYMHGPLRRILTGEDSLQGTDYTYTVEGWLKGINHPKIDAVGLNDPGRDATGTSRVGADAMGMVLGYYDGDYLRKKGAAQSQFNSATTGGYTAQTFNLSGGNLYNGNITSWSSQLMWTSILPSAFPWPFPPNGPGQYEGLNGTTFKYDRLNRLLSDTFMVSVNGGMGWTWNPMDDYSMAQSYDPNGNIQTLHRNGWRANPTVMPPPPDVGLKMDRQTFHYTTGGGTPTNDLLQYVAEDPTISSAAYSNDIDNQNAAGNYHYDAVGRLIRDDQAGEFIKWDPYGKVRTVKTPTQTITFFYDAAGNRVKKFAADDGATTATATYYVRSGDEKVLAIYSQSLHDLDGPTRESCNAGLTPDADGDKRPDAPVCDNCPGTAFNPFQEDYDGDGIGDACDLCPFTPNATPPTAPCPPPVNEGDVPPPQPPAPGTQPQWSVIETRLAELLIYGNGVHERFATMKPWTDRDSTMNPNEVYFTREIGKKFYELKDHLGDVRVVFSDIKIALAASWNGGVTVAPGNRPFMVDMVAYNNYYPFGMEQPARCYHDGSYRYGFNGKESDNELIGSGNSYDYGARIYNPRLGRFLSVDPLTQKYASLSPYDYVADDPINSVDPDGKKIIFVNGFYSSALSWLSLTPKGPGKVAYWGGGSQSTANAFVDRAQRFFGDYSGHTMFVDGSAWNNPNRDFDGALRYQDGYEYAKSHLKEIVGDLAEGENIEFFTHSQGSSFGSGMVAYLVEHEKEIGHKVSVVVHAAAFQPETFTASEEPKTFQIGYDGDPLAHVGVQITGVDYLGAIDGGGDALSQIGESHVAAAANDIFDKLDQLGSARIETMPHLNTRGPGIDNCAVDIPSRNYLVGTGSTKFSLFGNKDGVFRRNEDGSYDKTGKLK